MFKNDPLIYIISFFSFLLVISLSMYFKTSITYKRTLILKRLREGYIPLSHEEGDILNRPFMERTVGSLAQWLVKTVGNLTPGKARQTIEDKLVKAGSPRNLKASDFLVLQGVIGFTVLIVSWFLLLSMGLNLSRVILLSLALTGLIVYLPWFALAVVATRRQREIKRSLADILDLLVISVEAGLAFDMALLKVVERFRGSVAQEFHRSLKEMQIGKPRKDALKDMSNRVNLPELSALVNAIIQSDQLGVGLGNVLRIQSDLIKEKRQQWVEEQAMKAPVKMLFPLVFLIFPCIFIILLGPAILNIMKVLGDM